MFTRLKNQFMRSPDETSGGGGGRELDSQGASLGSLLGDVPDDTPAQPGVDEPPVETTSARRPKAKTEEVLQDAAGTDPKPKADANVKEETTEEEKPETVSDEQYKKLYEDRTASNKRLRADNDALRATVAKESEDAQLLRNIQGMLLHEDPAHRVEGLKTILGVAAQRYDNDIVKTIASLGYTVEPTEPDDLFAKARESVKAKLAEKVAGQGWNNESGEDKIVERNNAELVDMIFDELSPLMAVRQSERPVVAQAPTGGGHPQGSFDNVYVSAVQSIQEEVPMFEISRAEAEEAMRRFKDTGLDLESAIRLTYDDRLHQERSKQEKAEGVKPMVHSNGKVGRTSVLSPDRINEAAKSGTYISLSEAMESFSDQSGGK